MEDKKNSVLGYVKEHKVEILVSLGIAALGGVCLYEVLKWKPSVITDIPNVLPEAEKVNDIHKKILPSLGVGKLEDALKYKDGTIELWIDDLTIGDIGKFGEEITNNISDVPDNAKIWALLTIREKTE